MTSYFTPNIRKLIPEEVIQEYPLADPFPPTLHAETSLVAEPLHETAGGDLTSGRTSAHDIPQGQRVGVIRRGWQQNRPNADAVPKRRY